MTQGNDYPETRRAPTEPKDRRDTFAVGRAKPPPHLDKVARKLFKQLAAKLTTAGVLRDVDEIALGELCQAQADVARYTAQLAEEGEWLKGPNGGKVYNPVKGDLKDARRRVKEWSDRLGLNIKARAHLRFPAGAGHSRTNSEPNQMELLLKEIQFTNGQSWNRPDDPAATVPFPKDATASG